MSTGIFYLDEEPEQTPTPAKTSTVGDLGSFVPSRPSSPTSPTSTSQSSARETTATRPTPGTLQLPQAFTTIPGHRRQTASFAATPSFPSPLAQAIVPLNSDTSSSSSHSSDDERDAGTGQDSPASVGSGTPRLREAIMERPRTVSPNPSRAGGSRGGSPSSTEKSFSRPPSPSIARPQPMTPGSFLNKARRSTSGTLAPPNISGSLPNPSPLRESPPRTKNISAPIRRMEDLSRTKSKAHNRERSGSSASSVAPGSSVSAAGSSPRNHYSPELFPIDTARSAAGSPTDTRENTLGLGLGWTGWEASSASGSSSYGSGSVGGRGPGSEQDSRSSRGQGGVGSPARQRRPSEFLNTAGSGKMPILGGRQSLGALPVANLSTSASMISPLNPLPSPWTTSGSESSAFGSPNQPEASSAASSSGNGAMRLNRVPTSVKLATELMKSQSISSSSPSMASSMELPQIHSSLPTSATKRDFPHSSRDLGHSSSMPPPPPPHPPSALDLGKGRPTISVPSTPAPQTNAAALATPASIASVHHSSSSSSSTSQTHSRPRPSLPAEAESSGPFLSVGARHNRYRTSMHESITKPLVVDEFTRSPPQWTPPTAEAATLGRSSPYGLGLNLPSNKLLQLPVNVSGTMTPVGGLPSGRPRIRSTTDKTLQMDLAGLTQLGDAASHANMIMQSRQAKLQRWRPNSAGNSGAPDDKPIPPAFNRSTTSSSPAMLAAARSDRQAAWDVHEPARASSFGEDLPNFPAAMGGAGISPSSAQGSSPLDPSSGSLRSAVALLQGGMGMEREPSAGGTVGGIEWVDWYDCYKRYKDQKIRAEAQAVRVPSRIPEERSLDQASISAMGSTSTSPTASTTDEGGPSRGSASRNTGLGYDGESALALTPSTSRDEYGSVNERSYSGQRRRSLSLRSSIDLKSAQRKSSVFERPRQVSAGSTRSTDTGNSAAIKRKKNLVSKMEGWWSAVKSNFIPENQFPPPYRSSGLGRDRTRRLPSAPGSRRGSENSPVASPTATPSMSGSLREQVPPPQQILRNAASHADIRPRVERADSALNVSTSADISRIAQKTVVAPISPRAKLLLPAEDGPSSRGSLDSRRRQPNLRLDLDSNVLSRPPARMPANPSRSGSSTEQVTQRPSEQTSRSSSYGPLYGPGLTPGLPLWNQTPSPIVPVNLLAAHDQLENRPVAPGAELTVASVRRHVKRRLNAAKEVCDDMLREMIASITTFAEEQKRTVERSFEDAEDYFESISDSPLVDADESDGDFGDAFDGLGPRTVSSSRGPSRRASISRATGTSPSRRMSMLPSSPSRRRRRTSTVPARAMGQRDRVARGFNFADRAHSASSSRSTSRSRSPMPVTIVPDTDRRFLAALQELIVLATDVLESSINQLIAKPTMCSDVIQSIQKVGRKWDDNESWPGRSWYLSILMEVAKLSQVLDWWEAEKGFWNFDAEEVENEPLVFVMKPQREENRQEEQPRPPSSAGLLSPLSHPQSPSPNSLQIPEPLPELMLEVASPTSPTGKRPSETPKARAAENLQILADHAKSVNIVMELSLQGEEVQYINDAIMEVTGRDPDDVLFRPITEILAPADASTFAEATQKLLEDDNNTVQLRVRLELHEVPDDRDQTRAPGPMYIELEGVGMLMRELDAPSHTMWVLKPVPATQTDTSEAAFPKDGRIAIEGILCRICERDIATWFFEKHNETCDAVHRLEAEITEADECLHDLRRTVLKLNAQIGSADDDAAAQYQGVLFLTLPESVQGDNGQPAVLQLVERKKVTQQHLVEAAEILQTAVQIESPAVRQEETDLPFNLQRYLDPESEEKLLKITRWQRPTTTDHALALLFTHVEDQLRRKHKAIARMQSTIRYSEKTRHEWEDKVNQVLGEQETSGSDSGSDSAGAADASIATVIETVDPGDSPPSHRKIAPQARLPVTLGHSGRPTTSHADSGSATVPPTPIPQLSAPPSPALEPPKSAPVRSLTNDAPAQTLLKPDRNSPRLTPADGGVRTHARRPSKAFRDMPLSPRIPSAALNRGAPPSIKDFEIIKPISRGAFGSVYLAKKVATGDYFAIKALKKSDMIAKNQITNVKAERTILMNQATSPYVVKLFFSFQSKDYLYLVMEYLNGGDCATLVKTLGGLPEDWARNYIAEVVLGLEYLHARNIVHRDIKPDNLLIDSKGHLKLTDFGLSRIGLLNRQVAGPRPAYLRGTSLRAAARPLSVRTNSSNSPAMSPDMVNQARQQGYFSSAHDSGSADESSGSESASVIPKHLRHLSKVSSDPNSPSATGREPPKVVGTPDYLAPESILGIGNDDRTVDWWALGVVLYEFIYGVPPFHADTPSQVFDNIVSRRIEWHEDEVEISAEARDLMDRLMCSNPDDRLGSRGAEEVKQHAFFADLDWSSLTDGEASFIPQVTDPESTDYFDARGAVHGFHDEDAPQVTKAATGNLDVSPMALAAMDQVTEDIAAQEDFGTFNFRNLPVLKQANDDMIRKLRVDSMVPIGQALDAALSVSTSTKRVAGKTRARRRTSDLGGPPSPTTSNSSAASTPSRSSGVPTTPSTIPPVPVMPQHLRRPSELNALDRVKSSDDGDLNRRSSAPSRLRAGSGSSVVSDRSTSMELWRQRRQVSLQSDASQAGSGSGSGSFPSSSPFDSPDIQGNSNLVMMDRTLDVLIAEDNPISQKILETLLTRMGCRCICVEDGPQALAATMGSIRFDVIICDIHMPVVNGEQVARMIRSTNNHNQNTPIIAATSYEKYQAISEEGTLFSAVLAKPVSKIDLTRCLAKLGFELSSNAAPPDTPAGP